MALKRKLKTLDGLADSLKPLYVEKDGEFLLDVEADEDISAALRARDHEKAQRKEQERLRLQAEKELETLQTELAQAKNPDAFKALEKSYQEKLTAEKTRTGEQISKLQDGLKRAVLTSTVDGIAAKFKTPTVIRPFIEKQLDVDLSDTAAPRIVVVDAQRQPTATTIVEFTESLLKNPEFADIITGSRSSGGGAPSKSAAGGGAPTNLDFATASVKDVVAAIDAKKGT